MLKVINTGPQLLFQDKGRFGMAGSGIAPSGSFDRMSAARANHAMGNTPDAPVVEILLGGAEFAVLHAVHAVVTGMRCRIEIGHANGTTLSAYSNVILDLSPGDTLRIGMTEDGMRGYLAIRGGFEATQVLGSAATDVMSGLGPAPLAAGDVLQAGNFAAEQAWWPRLRELPALWPREKVRTLAVILGPRSDWFEPAAIETFFEQTYTISDKSNRIGLRVEGGKALTRSNDLELPSEGMVRGSIQVPPSGMPVIFGPDHPVTGGYPVIGVLTGRSSDHSAQCAPGDLIRFIRAH